MRHGIHGGLSAPADADGDVLVVQGIQGSPSNSNSVCNGTTPDLVNKSGASSPALARLVYPAIERDSPALDRSPALSSWALEMCGCSALVLDATSATFPVVRMGPGFERLTGYSEEEYLGRDYDFLQGPATDLRALDQLYRAVRTGSPSRSVIRSYRKNGTAFWNEISLAPVTDARGDVQAVRVLQCDVTERVEARGQLELLSTLLADRQQFTSAILEGIHTAIITADARGRVTFINRAACKTLGVTPAQCAETGLIPLLNLPPDVFNSLSEADRVKRLAYTFRRDDGQMIEMGLSMSRAFDDARHDLGYFVVLRDLSDTMQFEIDVRRVERLAAIGTMVAGFAHEIRNPVTTLRLLTEVLRADAPEVDPAQEYLSRMMLQIERIERLVKTSLQFGRPVAPRRAERSAAAIVTSALEAMAGRLNGVAGGPLRTEIDAGLGAVFADDAQIAQILVILLDNALDAAGRAERVTLRARASAANDAVLFEVVDKGPGIPQWVMNRIFDPFFTTKPNGTGLGLSIAQQLVHENRGRIEASSVEGSGATFTVIIPRTQPDDAAQPGAVRHRERQ